MHEDFKNLMYPKPSEFIETFNGGANLTSRTIDRPFNGAWGDDKWPDKLRLTELPKNRIQYQVAARVEPVGDIIQFAHVLAAKLGTTVRNPPNPEHKSMLICYDVTGKDVHQAMSYASFKISRTIRKTKFPIKRLSFDIREVPKNA